MIGEYDYFADQQTGDPASDIVGAGINYGMFSTFNDNGSASATDGTLGFRLRLDDRGGNKNVIEFRRNAWIGIDADMSGSIDVFLGLNLQGNAATLGIFAPGSGTNHSPNKTTVSSTAYITYALSAANYDYRPVDYLTDGGTTNDVTPSTSGDPDYYVSFMIPFADVVSFLAGRSIQINDETPLRYISATTTQGNRLNQDLGGVNGGVTSNSAWTDLGAFTPPATIRGNLIPEPSGSILMLASLAAGCFIRRRQA
jgi:hypothetical protein